MAMGLSLPTAAYRSGLKSGTIDTLRQPDDGRHFSFAFLATLAAAARQIRKKRKMAQVHACNPFNGCDSPLSPKNNSLAQLSSE
jgi:hypothetical protein